MGDGQSQGILTEGEGSVQLTSLYKLVEIANIIFLNNEEVNSTEPSPSVSLP
jgi:hypothetical protein